ncbi:hypothetical protein D3C72_2141070 [compost metagenome]
MRSSTARSRRITEAWNSQLTPSGCKEGQAVQIGSAMAATRTVLVPRATMPSQTRVMLSLKAEE